MSFSQRTLEFSATGLRYLIMGIFTGETIAIYNRGHYIVEGNSLTAKIQVSYYRGKFQSLFGPVDKYDLTLSGNAGEDTFKMSGHISGWSERQITVEGQKQADLVTQPSPPLRPSLHPYPSPA